MDKGRLVISSLLVYDLFWAGICILCNSGSGNTQLDAEIGSSIEKCLMLLTVAGERFPDLKSIRRALSLASALCKDGSSSNLVSRFGPVSMPES